MNVDRRTFLLGAAAAVLTGCAGGKDDPRIGTQARAQARRTVAIDYASYYAPIEDVKRLVNARAAALGATVTFSDDPSGVPAQVKQLKAWTGDRGGFNVIAVAPFDVAAVEPIAAAAIHRGIEIVSYITPLKNQTAGIVVDRAAAGRLLADDAGHGRRALLVGPPAKPAVPLPFAPGWADAEAEIRTIVDVRATVEAQADADAIAIVGSALRADPSIEVVLCWNDLTAIGAASTVNDPDEVYVGGLGAPSLSDPRALRLRGALQCLVAARISDLAAALVEVPLAYAQGKKPGSRVVPMTVVKRGSDDLRAFATDFAPG
jgi:ribose transport system permease protein